MTRTISLAVAAALFLAACSTPAPTPTASALAVACEQAGGYSAECLAVAAAAAKVVPISRDAGIRADVVSKGTWWHVVFTTSSGQQASADVVWSPVGTLAGVNGAATP